ncbi:MAG: hypothetical protein JXO22_07510 [Phycisphaerae bacterium]|nr:hypothetical protein [Phycisphaerae bacterium]
MTASRKQPVQPPTAPPPAVPNTDQGALDAENATLGRLLREALADLNPDERTRIIRTATTRIIRNSKADA